MLALDPTDTIAATASPPAGGQRGLVRVTGPRAFEVTLVNWDDGSGRPSWTEKKPERRTGRLQVEGLRRPLVVEINGWPGTKTYTGQPLVEVAATGAPAVLQAILATFLRRGARLAEPGEFTLRAFLAGRIDLTQSEAVLGVIDAANPAQLDVALRQLAGGLAGPITRLRDDLADTLAHLEANLDFADEADVDPIGRALLAQMLDRQSRRGCSAGRPPRRAGPVERAAPGRPGRATKRWQEADYSTPSQVRTGRSSSTVAGTTRDYLEAACHCDGLVVDLVDTAGQESGDAAIARLAQDARLGQATAADLLLDCRPLDDPSVSHALTATGPGWIMVGTRADLADRAVLADLDSTSPLATSAATGAGLTALRAAIADRLRGSAADDFGAGPWRAPSRGRARGSPRPPGRWAGASAVNCRAARG